ncbi:hypothetical protein ACFQRB_20045 [Halobaculum litoreum]|uniref:Uncharacterized protein n=1 Tax=Halobaculum litoreum TaxID=3031998 RepID=A0ABD5Y158_9EURY
MSSVTAEPTPAATFTPAPAPAAAGGCAALLRPVVRVERLDGEVEPHDALGPSSPPAPSANTLYVVSNRNSPVGKQPSAAAGASAVAYSPTYAVSVPFAGISTVPYSIVCAIPPESRQQPSSARSRSGVARSGSPSVERSEWGYHSSAPSASWTYWNTTGRYSPTVTGSSVVLSTSTRTTTGWPSVTYGFASDTRGETGARGVVAPGDRRLVGRIGRVLPLGGVGAAGAVARTVAVGAAVGKGSSSAAAVQPARPTTPARPRRPPTRRRDRLVCIRRDRRPRS